MRIVLLLICLNNFKMVLPKSWLKLCIAISPIQFHPSCLISVVQWVIFLLLGAWYRPSKAHSMYVCIVCFYLEALLGWTLIKTTLSYFSKAGTSSILTYKRSCMRATGLDSAHPRLINWLFNPNTGTQTLLLFRTIKLLTHRDDNPALSEMKAR